jgi:parvulin-like peptidyl-prolyl isomerase
MTQEQLRMQMLAGVITEGQYKAKLNEDIDAQIAQLQAQIALLQKQKETGGKIPLTPEQTQKWEKRNKVLYRQTQAFKNDYYPDDFPGLSAQVLISILSPEERDEEKAAQKLGFEDFNDFESEVEKMLDKMGYEWWN